MFRCVTVVKVAPTLNSENGYCRTSCWYGCDWIIEGVISWLSGRWHPKDACKLVAGYARPQGGHARTVAPKPKAFAESRLYMWVACIIGFLRMPYHCVYAYRAFPPCGRAYPATSLQASFGCHVADNQGIILSIIQTQPY